MTGAARHLDEQRRELAERLGCPTPDALPFYLEGEPSYRACEPREATDRCGGCDRCLLDQAVYWHEQVPL